MNRIKTLAIALFAILTVCTAEAQSIVKQDVTMDDFIKHLNRTGTVYQTVGEVQGDYIQYLNQSGVKAFAFDIISMKMNKYEFIIPVIMKYENGETVNLTQNKGYMYVNHVAPHLTVGISSINDSTMQSHLYFGDSDSDSMHEAGLSYWKIPFKMVHGSYYIDSTPFAQPKELKLDEFIPLMAVSSGWYDEENECIKNCDVVEFDPQNYLNTETFKKSPLIYVIGLKCLKR